MPNTNSNRKLGSSSGSGLIVSTVIPCYIVALIASLFGAHLTTVLGRFETLAAVSVVALAGWWLVSGRLTKAELILASFAVVPAAAGIFIGALAFSWWLVTLMTIVGEVVALLFVAYIGGR